MPATSKPGEVTPPSVSRRSAGSGPGGRLASESQHPLLVVAIGWLVPGAGHFAVGNVRKAVVLFAVLTFMYVVGLGLGGRLFPLQGTEPLVFLSSAAEWAAGLPRLTALVGGFGQGNVTAASYEYGNTFLIVSGLLNALAMLDAYDIAMGRKS
jgi:hypothetical protein